jgi:hypothetical protein
LIVCTEFLELHKDVYKAALDSRAPEKASCAVVQAIDQVYYSAAFYFKLRSSGEHLMTTTMTMTAVTMSDGNIIHDDDNSRYSIPIRHSLECGLSPKCGSRWITPLPLSFAKRAKNSIFHVLQGEMNYINTRIP